MIVVRFVILGAEGQLVFVVGVVIVLHLSFRGERYCKTFICSSGSWGMTESAQVCFFNLVRRLLPCPCCLLQLRARVLVVVER